MDRERMEKSVGKQAYLGDGLYAEFDPANMIILKTDRALGVRHWVGLEPKVFIALIEFANQIGWGDLVRSRMPRIMSRADYSEEKDFD